MKKIYFLMVAALMMAVLSFSAFAEELSTGVYTVQNIADGTYLNSFDRAYSKAGYAYTDKYSGEEGENILVIANGDGTYLLYPQSETGKYAFTVSSDKTGERVSKAEALTDGSYFRLVKQENGFTIETASGKVLGTTDKKTLYRMRLVTTEEKTLENTQLWDFSPVAVSSVELKTVSKKVNVNSVSAVYAVVKPSYMANFVEWESSNESVVMMDNDGTFCALSEGVSRITATVSGISASIDVTVVDEDAFTWYSQHLTTKGGWHAKELEKVYFYSGSYKRFIINGYNRGLDWMDEGCAITSAAIVLKNLGARYDGAYDFRVDAEGSLEADPYTVALANTNSKGLAGPSGTLYKNPVLMSLKNITSNFTLYGQPLTYKTTYNVTKAKLKEAVEEHPEGVIVYMKNRHNGSHYIVVTECINPDAAKASDYRFKIYDPSGLYGTDGDGVAFERSISYVTMRYRYANMVSMSVIEFDPKED